jgi:hypothetical protein
MASANLVSAEELTAALHRHAPVVRFHPSEQHLPCTVEFFLQSSDLYKCGAQNDWHLIPTAEGQVGWTPEALIAAQSASGGAALKLRPRKLAWGGQSVKSPGCAPTYCYAEVVDPMQVAPYLRRALGRVVDLKYVFVYTYNGTTFRVPPLPPALTPGSIGCHLGDIEHVLVRVDLDKQKVLEVRTTYSTICNYVTETCNRNASLVLYAVRSQVLSLLLHAITNRKLTSSQLAAVMR